MRRITEGTHRACHFIANIHAAEGADGFQVETDLVIDLPAEAKDKVRRSFDLVAVDNRIAVKSTLTGAHLTPRQAEARAVRLARRRIDSLLGDI